VPRQRIANTVGNVLTATRISAKIELHKLNNESKRARTSGRIDDWSLSGGKDIEPNNQKGRPGKNYGQKPDYVSDRIGKYHEPRVLERKSLAASAI